MKNYRVILLDISEFLCRNPEADYNIDAEDLPDMYDKICSSDRECFFCQEFSAPNDEAATLMGRGILFNNDFCSDGTVSFIQRVD
jgi:hypothetical protein